MVLSIPRVLLKPSIAESEFDGILLDDETRSKRQTQFFDLLHEAIEKYANCANEHLAPLRALANYKQYETFVYPEEYSQPAQTIVGDSVKQQNKPNLKCTKVNLCSIEKQHSHTAPRYNTNSPPVLRKSRDPKSPNSQESRRNFPYNSNNYVRLPIYGSNQVGLKNMPPIYNPRYSYVPGKKNFTSLALNRSFFDKLLYRPIPANRKQIVITPTQNTRTEANLGSENTTPVNGIKSCTCSKVTTEKPPTTLGVQKSASLKSDNKNKTGNKEEIKQISTTTESGLILGSKLNISTSTGKPKSCSCLKNTTPKPQNEANFNIKNTSTESEPLLGSTRDNITSTSYSKIQTHTSPKVITDKAVALAANEPQSNQNLNLLFLQLDIMAHNESKEDLKEILKKLSALKSALKITEHITEKTELRTETFSTSTATPISTISTTTLKTTTTTSPTSAISSTTLTTTTTTEGKESNQVAAEKIAIVSTTSKEQKMPLVAAKEPEIVATISTIATKNENTNITKAFNDTENMKLHKSNQLNNTNMEQSQTILKTDNSNTLPTRNILNTTTIIHTSSHSGNNTSQLLTALKDLSLKLNLNKSEDITKVSSSQPLQLNITTSKDLSRITNEINSLVSSMANKSKQGNSEQHHSKSDLSRIKNEMNSLAASMANKTNQGNSQQDHTKSENGKAMDIMIIRKTISTKNNKTLSSSHGNITLPDIHFQGLTSKDQLKNLNQLVANLNDSLVSNPLHHNNNDSSINSTITISISSNGSFKKIQVEQQSPSDKNLEINEKENMNLEPYAEPILSEIYPLKRKLKTKPPLSIYWHRIEEKPLKLKEIPSKNWKADQSDDYDDEDDETDSGNEENLSTLLKECSDYEDLTESEETQSEEDNHKPRFRDICKHITYLT
ncbi:serine-rich adhesin for platelets-like [Calliphora vicina]|uniref:serine-rich adhesin for platelets-like n=1 Tax=Calliphora vicina TaxID=7373 RepID=UPI00325B150F